MVHTSTVDTSSHRSVRYLTLFTIVLFSVDDPFYSFADAVTDEGGERSSLFKKPVFPSPPGCDKASCPAKAACCFNILRTVANRVRRTEINRPIRCRLVAQKRVGFL